MELGGHGKWIVVDQGCADRSVEMHQLPMASEAGPPAAAGLQIGSSQHRQDGVHHKFMFQPIFGGSQQR